MISRLGVSIHGYIFYLYKSIVPTGLSLIYPYPESVSFLSLKYGGSLLLVIAISALAFYCRRRLKALPAVWAYYVITLLPVIGIVQVGLQSAANRYTYLPMLGPCLLAALVITALTGKGRRGYLKAGVLVLLISIAFSVATLKQAEVWKDSVTLWTWNLKHHPRSFTSYYNLAEAQKELGELKTALVNYSLAIEISPESSASIYADRGAAYLLLSEYSKALNDFNTALKLNPRHANAHFKRGLIYAKLGKAGNKSSFIKAVNDYTLAIETDPNFADAFHARAISNYQQGYYKEAERDYLTTIKLLPDEGLAYLNLAKLYLKTGNRTSAKKYFDSARKLGFKNYNGS